MSKLDDVLDGTPDDTEELAARESDEVGGDGPDEAQVAELKAKLEEVEANPVEPSTTEAAGVLDTGAYTSEEDVLTAQANGEITEEQAIRLLDELDQAEAEESKGEGDVEPDVDDLTSGRVAGPRDRVRIVKTGETVTVAYGTGGGGIATEGDKPRRTFARDEYVFVD